MNENLGQATFRIIVDTADAQRQVKEFQVNLSDMASNSSSSTKTMSEGFSELTSSIAQLATAHLALSGTASAIGDVVNSYNQYQASMNGVKAVASATGNSVAESINAVKEVTANGLLSQSDAAASIKNLELYGYSVQDATEMIKIMTNAAVYNRQANYSVSEAVRVTTEGIRMENSVLSDASGITKNIAKMHEDYATSLGKSAQSLTDVEKQQAVLNGVMAEGGIFAGNAEEYTHTLAGSQQQLDTAITQVKQTMGAMFDQFSPIISTIATWVSENKELVATISMIGGAIAGGAGLLVAFNLAKQAIQSIRKTIVTLNLTMSSAQKGLLGLAAAAIALTTGSMIANGLNAMMDEADKLGESSQATQQKVDELKNQVEQLGKEAQTAAEQVAKLEKQLAELERDYRRDLKQIAVNHEENLEKLTSQIEEANIDYRRAIDERTADFNVTMAKQERSHQETVNELMAQLNFLQRYNNDYNKQKLAQVQFALEKEKHLYQQETLAQEEEIRLQNENDRIKLEQKLANLQGELDDELAFMNKHRGLLNSVREEILLDEVESLQERFNKQRESLNKQVEDARQKGAEAAVAYQNAWGDLQKTLSMPVKTNYTPEGEAAADSWLSGFDRYLRDHADGLFIKKGVKTENGFFKDTWNSIFGFSTGGYTGRGAPNEVAGVVHRGEYVVPAEQVDQNTGTPKLAAQNITINLSGILATSPQAKRELAQELQHALTQINQSRLS